MPPSNARKQVANTEREVFRSVIHEFDAFINCKVALGGLRRMHR